MSLAFSYILYSYFGRSFLGKSLLTILVLSVIAVLGYMIITSPFFYRIIDTFEGGVAGDNRLYLFLESLKVWNSTPKNFLIGIGLGNFIFYNPLFLYTHSTISETLVSTGIIGFLIYFSSIASVILLFIKLRRKSQHKQKQIAELMLIFLLLILVFNAFAVMIYNRLFWPMLGIVSAYGVNLRSSDTEIRSNPIPT
jgi:O-antigen ligase